MSSGRVPTATIYQARDAADFQIHNSAGDTITEDPMHPEPLDIEQFMMENTTSSTPQAQNASAVNATPPQLDVIGNSQFADFSFSYQTMPENGLHVDTPLDNPSDLYNLSGHGSNRNSIGSLPADHRNSITSTPGVARAGLSGGGAVGQGQSNRSVSAGSDEASPSSNRGSGGLEKGYSDDFGLNSGGALDGSDLGNRTKEEKNDPNPPWSELKTKAGKERKRLPLACIACRRKKIRCSGEKPACKHCLRSRIPCVYKVTTRKAAPRTDYMAMLDKRLKRMEERIIKIVPKEEQDASAASVTRATVKSAIPGTVPTRTTPTKKRGADEAFGPELDEWSKPADSQLDMGSRPSSLMIQEAEESKLLSEGADALPPKEIQEHLAEVFFENIYGQAYHVLHKPSFMRKLKSGTVPPVLILSVCAISARFSTHPKLNSTPNFLRGEEWASEARDILMRRYEWPNITILTCLLLLGLHEFGTCQGGRSWSLGGMAIRMAYALQLHRDLDYDPLKRNGTAELSFIDREIRRRTMWACFLMDRFNSSGTDRPSFIKEDSIKVQLPIKEKLFQLDMPGPTEDLRGNIPHPVSPGAGQLSDPKENMGVAAYMIRSIALWGRIINYLNLGGKEHDHHLMWHPESTYADLLNQAEGFITTQPESLQYTKENLHAHETEGLANQFLFLHVAMQQNILFMNRFGVPGHPGGRPPPDMPKEFVTRAGAKAFKAANRISEILRDAESYFVTAPFAGYCAFLSSTVHIFGTFSKNAAIEALSKKNLATNVKYLSKMKKYWGMFHFMSENLKDQFRVYADAARQGPSANKSTPSSGIFQYGDWFDRYPHGVSQSDFEDPITGINKEKGDDAVLEQKSDYRTVEEFFHTLSPLRPQDRELVKPTKRKLKKPPQTRPVQMEPLNTNVPNMLPASRMQMHNAHQMAATYNQMSPTTPVNLYNQTPLYGSETMMPPLQQGSLSQLDRQLVFGAYAGMDPSSLNSHGMLDGTGWDMHMGGMPGYMTEPSSSAWFMPFNMDPPEIGQEADIFAAGAGYGMGGMPVNGNRNMGGYEPRR
ncbi:Zn2 DNA-binding protein [Venustampulla echinocandica]|uniref:Zn2 DNA-binding protein n=1 Tax=Venustampulla echinocandica TaxID=2656787 RepID=A0A370TYT9_9HELO|nr:Zn2 DNA-binding protein [Venustampulla echinocandica]RDL40695.1 Zn2 DNA-binding protein [Venustampulla echinocandica]